MNDELILFIHRSSFIIFLSIAEVLSHCHEAALLFFVPLGLGQDRVEPYRHAPQHAECVLF
jgi:hypothetical protein